MAIKIVTTKLTVRLYAEEIISMPWQSRTTLYPYIMCHAS